MAAVGEGREIYKPAELPPVPSIDWIQNWRGTRSNGFSPTRNIYSIAPPRLLRYHAYGGRKTHTHTRNCRFWKTDPAGRVLRQNTLWNVSATPSSHPVDTLKNQLRTNPASRIPPAFKTDKLCRRDEYIPPIDSTDSWNLPLHILSSYAPGSDQRLFLRTVRRTYALEYSISRLLVSVIYIRKQAINGESTPPRLPGRRRGQFRLRGPDRPPIPVSV